MRRRLHHAGLALALLVSGSLPANADPLFFLPRTDKGKFGDADKDAIIGGLVLQARMVGVLGARRLTYWADRQHGLEPGRPELIAGQVGGYLQLTRVPLTFVLRADGAELTRPKVPIDRKTFAVVDAIVDDAYIRWHPARPFHLIVGRARVPFSKARQIDDMDQLFGAPPFVIDRIAPDRRWGATVLGDLGSMSYAAGAYADMDSLESRAFEQDPSSSGRMAYMGHIEWTPRAPMYGSSAPKKIPGAEGFLPTPRADPWFATHRVSVGIGTLFRDRKAGTRLDLSLSAHWKFRFLAAVGEVMFSQDEQRALGLSGTYAELIVTPIDKLAISVRGEWDAELGQSGQWTTGAGLLWHATPDRQNKIGFFGWFRRDGTRDTPFDGAILYLQASL